MAFTKNQIKLFFINFMLELMLMNSAYSSIKVKCVNSKADLRCVLETSNLIMRSFEPRDFNKVYQLYEDSTVMKYVQQEIPLTREQSDETAQAWVDSWKAGNPASCLVAFEKGTEAIDIDNLLNATSSYDSQLGEFVGLFMLDPSPGPGSVEIGYVLAKNKWKQGYGTEGSIGLIDIFIPYINEVSESFEFNFSSIQKIEKVWATVSVGNSGSIRILDKLGFSPYPILSRKNQKKWLDEDCDIIGSVIDSKLTPRTLGSRYGVPKYFFSLAIQQ